MSREIIEKSAGDLPVGIQSSAPTPSKRRSVALLGTRGIPASHGGFETFAQQFALYLTKRDWDVTVYCQEDGKGGPHDDMWHGVRRVFIPVSAKGAWGTIEFDWKSVRHALNNEPFVLTLGYNTAILSVFYRMRGTPNLINMDGIEWVRQKWRWQERLFLYLNERAGCLLGSHLVADHPEIEKHLATRVSPKKITMIPYGADEVVDADVTSLSRFNLSPRQYALVIARSEPENSILEIVRAFSARPRGKKLVVLGNYQPDKKPFHKAVMEAASDEVLFLGPIYDAPTVSALRFYASLYIHGHTVGGTNPSLVEALAARSAVLAHDNRFNRWVAGDAARYFSDEKSCTELFDVMLEDEAVLETLRGAANRRHQEAFTLEKVLGAYEQLIEDWRPKNAEVVRK